MRDRPEQAETCEHAPQAGLAAVRRRFSHDHAAGKWDELYEGDSERLDEDHFRRRRDAAVAHVRSIATPRARILDLGCGAAPVLAELRGHGLDVVGLDCSADMLDNARRRLRQRGLADDGLYLGDCRNTAWPSRHFDIIVCLGVIAYVEDYSRVLDEIERLLKPGGTVLISWRNLFNPILSDPLQLARHLLRSALSPLLGERPRRPFELGQSLDFREVEEHMLARCFQPVAFHGIGFGPPRLGGRPLLAEPRAIRLSRRLTALAARPALHGAARWLADVSLWVYRKPGLF